MQDFLHRLKRTGFALPAALTGGLWYKGLHPNLPGWPCPLRALTGIPCPTCFLTRATSAALVGELGDSVQLHAFGPLLAAGLVWWSLASWHRGKLRPWESRARWPAAVAVIAASAVLVYWLLRLWTRSGGPAAPIPGLEFPAS